MYFSPVFIARTKDTSSTELRKFETSAQLKPFVFSTIMSMSMSGLISTVRLDLILSKRWVMM